jgi:flavin reductase (DIM6/NTAB) family NADH-FMN oxidoreductase RutF
MSLPGFFSMFDGLRRPRNVRGEGWVHHHPRDNFYQSTSFFPMPFAMITTVNKEGVTSIGPHSLTFPFDLIEQPSWMLISRAGSNTVENLRNGSKAAIHFVEFKKSWLKPIVKLGYPGLEAEEKMKDQPFKMVKSPSPEYADDPTFPLIMDDALEVFECEADGKFRYEPQRETDPIGCEAFWCLTIKNILMKESFDKVLQEQKVFPSIPISYGFRHNDAGDRRFFFTSHNKPFPVPTPTPEGLEWQPIYYAANKMDPDVRFTEDAVKQLVDIPKPFIKMALNGIVKEAKAQGVDFVDEDFVAAFNAKRKGERDNK